jgi:heme/copper-type cytochrome/quinol oxidase subunit 2
VRYTIAADPVGARMCWCRDCQRIASGSATVNVLFPEDAVAITGDLGLFTMIAAHTTLFLGVIQWLFGRFGVFTHVRQEEGSFMKDKFYRFYWLEHPLMMIIVITFITLGYLQAKKPVADAVKYRKALIFFVLALLVVLAAMPWPFRTIVGRPLFPGM